MTLHLANGNHYEGYWMHDMKEGPGRFFYKNTNKIYEAEWQADTAKCGVRHTLCTLATEAFGGRRTMIWTAMWSHPSTLNCPRYEDDAVD